MAPRAIVAGAALAAAVATSVMPAPAVAAGATCADATPVAGAVAGVVGAEDPEDWWHFAAPVPGSYAVVLTSTAGDADLGVGDGACTPLCTPKDNRLGPERCTVTVGTGGLTVVARSKSDRIPASYTIEVTPIEPAVVACSDGLDNDGDGFADQADTGCDSPADPSEDDGPCNDVAGVEVCVEVVPGSVARRYTATAPATEKYEIAGYVGTYRFRRAGHDVDLRCVVLQVEPHGTNDTCGFAGGALMRRDLTLYRVTPDLPETSLAGTRVKVCEADVTLTVDGSGDTFPAFVPC